MLFQWVKLYYIKYRRYIRWILSLLCLGLLLYFMPKFESTLTKVYQSSTLVGVISTLLGAIVGGIFTLIGSISVSKHQQKAQTQIRRKNVIYKPIYDELIKNYNDFSQDEPYTGTIVVGENIYGYRNIPQYSAWDRIKKDSRWLEVPSSLAKELNSLEKIINKYIEQRHIASTSITKSLNDLLFTQAQASCPLRNSGDMLLESVLSPKEFDLFKELVFFIKPTIEDDKKKDEIQKLFLRRCKSDQALRLVHDYYADWKQQEKRVITLLELTIRHISVRYEE